MAESVTLQEQQEGTSSSTVTLLETEEREQVRRYTNTYYANVELGENVSSYQPLFDVIRQTIIFT